MRAIKPVIVLIPEDPERSAEPLYQRRLVDKLDEIALHCASLPAQDSRAPDEILGYDEHGLPH